MKFFQRFFYITITATMVLAAACKKHQDVVPDLMIAKPVIGAQSLPDSTLTIGATLTVHPLISGVTGGTTFLWTVNGQSAGSDSTLAFTPTARGDYQLGFTVANAGGSSAVTYTIHVYGKYENGFFIVNEGWYSYGGGTLSFYRYDTQKLEDSVFTKENPGKDLGPNTSTLEFGTIYNNKLYLLTKYGGPLVAVDAITLKETGRIATDANSDYRALLPLDTTKALVSTGNGVFPLNLQTLTLGAPLASISGEADDMVKLGNYIFVLDGNGLDVLNAADYSIAKNFSNIGLGFAVTTDGSLYAAGSALDAFGNFKDSLLVKINPATLDTTNIKLPFEINGTFGFWHAGSIVASTKENAVFLAYNPPYEGGTTIYKYVAGNPASLAAPFITIAFDHELYGAGLGYDKSRNQLVVTTIQSGGYPNDFANNDLDFYDGTIRTGIRDLQYTGYFFPAQVVFH